jgi:predicted nucleotidyltransferase component of viral defense system
MHDRLHPIGLEELEPWRKHWGVPLEEARKRFVQFVVLESIAAEPGLKDVLFFKGGNALRFVYGNPRATIDLDFTADASLPDDENPIRQLLDRALLRGGKTFGIKLKCQRVDRKPPKRKATLPTYDIAIGFQLPGDRYFADFENQARQVSTVVKLEISFNDLVCESQPRQLSPNLPAQLRVCTLEDILAEKLRALLQQVIRNRTRPQDAFDIARAVREHGESLNLDKIATYLIAKCGVRGIHAARSAFADEEVKKGAAFEYDTNLAISQTDWIPFDEAWQTVLDLVGKLTIPE